MNVYHRNTNFQFILLWTISILLLVGAISSAFSGRFLLALLILGLSIIAGAVKIHGLSISRQGISIRRYYALGFQKKELIISIAKLDSIEFWEHGNLGDTASTDSWIDIIFLPALFVSGKKGLSVKASILQPGIKD